MANNHYYLDMWTMVWPLETPKRWCPWNWWRRTSYCGATRSDTPTGLNLFPTQPHGTEFPSTTFPDLQSHLEQPTWVIQNWLTIRAPGFLSSIRAVKMKAIQNVRSIRSYFAPVWGTLRVPSCIYCYQPLAALSWEWWLAVSVEYLQSWVQRQHVK